jgi:hypothetical protein
MSVWETKCQRRLRKAVGFRSPGLPRGKTLNRSIG